MSRKTNIDWTQLRRAAEIDAEDRGHRAARRRTEARSYLAGTDWMVIRQIETGEPLPADVVARRRAARAEAARD